MIILYIYIHTLGSRIIYLVSIHQMMNQISHHYKFQIRFELQVVTFYENCFI